MKSVNPQRADARVVRLNAGMFRVLEIAGRRLGRHRVDAVEIDAIAGVGTER